MIFSLVVLRETPSDIYWYIKSRKKDTQGIPPLKRRSGNGVAQSDLEKAEEFNGSEFNGQFTDVFNKNEHTEVLLLDRSAPFMDDTVVSKDRVTKLLKDLNPSKALGPDELHPRVQYLLIFFSNQLTLVKSLGNGLLQIFAPFSRKVESLACSYRPGWFP